MSALLSTDLELFSKRGIGEDLLAEAGVERVTDQEARDRFGIRYGGDVSGLIFPYFDPKDGHRCTARVRRDNPEIEGGKVKNKYVSAYGDRHHLYFPPGAKDLLADPSAPVVIVEAEKSALAGVELAKRVDRRLLFIATGGCHGWHGKIGIVENSKGQRVDEKGPLTDLDLVVWKDRPVIIAFDSNTAWNSAVRSARWALAEELTGRGAVVRLADIPPVDGVNGPDDAIAFCNDQVFAEVLDAAAPCADAARTEAIAAIDAIELTTGPVQLGELTRIYRSLATINDDDERGLLVSRAANALRGTVGKAIVAASVMKHRALLLQDRREISERARIASLLKVAVNPSVLIKHLETFFAERAFLPVGAALLLALFILITWTFELFDTCPYVSVESPVPECGKSTVLRLINAVCARGEISTSLTEAVLFRLVNEYQPTFLIDEAETLEGKSERAEGLRAIAHEGYKRGGSVARVEGEDRHIQRFNVYCPKVFSAIGGLTGALLSRCIVIHMSRAPKDFARRSSRLRALERDAKPLRRLLEAYSLQAGETLTKLYEAEPDEGYWPTITDREAELWGPLLIHARLAGPEVERQLLQVVASFTQSKRKIQANDWRVAQTIAVRDAIKGLGDELFYPADLLPELNDAEAWASAFAKLGDGEAGKRAKAAKVGRFLRAFRLKAKRDRTGSRYLRVEAIEHLSAHIPEGADKDPADEKEVDDLPVVKPNGHDLAPPFAPDADNGEEFIV
jgi:hypothetical protein